VLLVIFGAGASYDSDPAIPQLAFPHRPPLAAGLFTSTFGDIKDKHPESSILFPRLTRAGSKIEQELESIVSQTDTYENYNRGLVSLRYYLTDVLETCEGDWLRSYHPVTNYLYLVERLYRWQVDHQEKLVFLTFNYDTLLDDAYAFVFAVKLKKMSDYIGQESQKLFKVHGSTWWRRKVTTDGNPSLTRTDLTNENVLFNEMWPVTMTKEYFTVAEVFASDPLQKAGYIPAIAIPTINKDGFECPADHLTQLEAVLKDVDRVLVVGWRGMEAHFLRLWSKVGTVRLTKILVVSGSPEGASETVTNLRTGTGIREAVPTTHSTQGFTSFLKFPEEIAKLDGLLS
jgi:hypothetical protein